MIQVKEFLDTESSHAVKKVNEFLATLREDQVINVCYGSYTKIGAHGARHQRTAILVVYRTDG